MARSVVANLDLLAIIQYLLRHLELLPLLLLNQGVRVLIIGFSAAAQCDPLRGELLVFGRLPLEELLEGLRLRYREEWGGGCG